MLSMLFHATKNSGKDVQPGPPCFPMVSHALQIIITYYIYAFHAFPWNKEPWKRCTTRSSMLSHALQIIIIYDIYAFHAFPCNKEPWKECIIISSVLSHAFLPLKTFLTYNIHAFHAYPCCNSSP